MEDNQRNISNFVYDCLKYIVSFLIIFLLVTFLIRKHYEDKSTYASNNQELEDVANNLNINNEAYLQYEEEEYGYIFDEKVLLLHGDITYDGNNFEIFNSSDLIWKDIIISINANVIKENYGIQSRISQLYPNQSVKISSDKFPTSSGWFNTVQYDLKWVITSAYVTNKGIVEKGVFIKVFNEDLWNKEFISDEEKRKW